MHVAVLLTEKKKICMVLLKVYCFQKINVTSNLKGLSTIKDFCFNLSQFYPYYLNSKQSASSKQSALNLKLNIDLFPVTVVKGLLLVGSPNLGTLGTYLSFRFN